ncbi:MAG TPA: HAMP domain-containing sensor histidine kinase [Actinomycetota bacterium]|nr:HAMP domain-containing sensor histidine kinase [Actinomycetota bacterium]
MPLRRLLPLLTAALVALALLVAGVLAATAMRSYLIHQLDADLLRSQPGPASNGSGAPPSPPPGASPLSSDLYIQFADAAGTPLEQLSNLPAGQSAPQLPTLNRSQVEATAGQPFTANGWRILAEPTASGSVMVARSLSEVDATVTRLVALEVTVGLVVLVAVTALSTLAVRQSLRPLRKVQTTASAITAGDLSRRIPHADPRTEVGAVGTALNTMLDRLETSFQQRQQALTEARASEARMRQFVADASHELRTPLTSVRGLAELYRQGAVEQDGVAAAFASIEEQSQRMGLLVDELLLLARLDAERPLSTGPLDLLDVCTRAVQTAHPGDRPIALEVLPGSAAPIVLGDADRLRQVVDNLIGNALQHGRGKVAVAVGTRGDQAVIRVSDEGPGVPAADRDKVFDRFFRSSGDRSRATGGAGLGLSIVAGLVAAHGGSVSVDGPAFTVLLPLAR